jgi:hypothetical protein
VARQHGADCRVYLGGRDASGDLASITPKAMADTHEVTNFASANWKEYEAGLLEWSVDLDGFYDPAAAGIGRQLEDIGGSIAATSIYDGDADAIGDTGQLYPAGVLTTTDSPISVADMRKVTGSIKGNGRAGLFGKLLHPKAEETATGDGASLDNGASSANGGRGNLHITAITGTWTIKIQHSANNSTWADLVTFTQAAAAGGVTSESIAVTGTVNRYLRVARTEDVSGSCTFVAGFARY